MRVVAPGTDVLFENESDTYSYLKDLRGVGFALCRRTDWLVEEGWDDWYVRVVYARRWQSDVHLVMGRTWAWINAVLPESVRVLYEYKIVEW